MLKSLVKFVNKFFKDKLNLSTYFDHHQHNKVQPMHMETWLNDGKHAKT